MAETFTESVDRMAKSHIFIELVLFTESDASKLAILGLQCGDRRLYGVENHSIYGGYS